MVVLHSVSLFLSLSDLIFCQAWRFVSEHGMRVCPCAPSVCLCVRTVLNGALVATLHDTSRYTPVDAFDVSMGRYVNVTLVDCTSLASLLLFQL